MADPYSEITVTDSTCLINIEQNDNYPSVVISQDDTFGDTLLKVGIATNCL